MEWYVYRHDTNKGTIYEYNVLQPYIVDQIKEKIEEPTTFSNFKEIVKREMQYYYWGKSEHEVIIKEWCGKSAELKVDIFDQLQLNWEVFCLYVWNSLLEKEEKSKEKDTCQDCQCKDCIKAHQPSECLGCRCCVNGDDFIAFGNCVDYKNEKIEDIEDTEEEEVQQEDVCKDCLCRTCTTENCSRCKDCCKDEYSVVESCSGYEEKNPGLWIKNTAGDLICNKCGNYPLENNGEVYLSDFCPFCGNRMENCSCGELLK